MSYRNYTEHVAELAAYNQTSGNKQSEDYIHYTMLNNQRMRRWERKLTLDTEQKRLLQELHTPYIGLVLTESWCGDAAPVLPAFQKLAEEVPFLELRIAFRDMNPELMDQFLTDNARSIPKILLLSPQEENRVVGTWGPRPEEARRMVQEYKGKHGKLDAEFRESLQRWYNKDKGKSILSELTALLTLE